MENYIEWIGYLASLTVLISLLMRSIKKLRIINTIGSLIFAIYGLQIGSYPVMIMNLGIVFINLYYLKQIYTSTEYFTILPFEKNEEYAKKLIEFYQSDINQFMKVNELVLKDATFRFLVLRNMNPAGIFVAQKSDDNTLEITLDYATPQFQDFKTGAHIYEKAQSEFKQSGFSKFIMKASSEAHKKYLEKMGFQQTTWNDESYYLKNI